MRVPCVPSNDFPESINRCSRIGPRLKAGKKVSAHTIKIVEASRTVTSGPVTGKVPRDAGAVFFLARLPAIARMGTTTKNLPSSMANAVLVLYQGVLAFKPPNADPLFPVADV